MNKDILTCRKFGITKFEKQIMAVYNILYIDPQFWIPYTNGHSQLPDILSDQLYSSNNDVFVFDPMLTHTAQTLRN